MPVETPVLMIVDDDKDFVQSISDALQMRGFDVLPAYNGTEAFDILEERTREYGSPKIEAVLSDWMMDGGDGIELLSKIRQSPTLRAVPFILVSGQVSRERLDAAIRLDADAVLLKPFDAEAIVNKIREAALLREAKQIRKDLTTRRS